MPSKGDNMIKPLLFAAGLVIFAAGCASGPKFSEYRPTVSPPATGDGRIWFYRPSAFGAAVQPAVNLDGGSVGNAVPHGFFYVDTRPGSHEVSCTTEWTHKASVNVESNQDKYVRLEIMMGLFVGHIVPKEVPESKALKEMNDLHLASPK